MRIGTSLALLAAVFTGGAGISAGISGCGGGMNRDRVHMLAASFSEPPKEADSAQAIPDTEVVREIITLVSESEAAKPAKEQRWVDQSVEEISTLILNARQNYKSIVLARVKQELYDSDRDDIYVSILTIPTSCITMKRTKEAITPLLDGFAKSVQAELGLPTYVHMPYYQESSHDWANGSVTVKVPKALLLQKAATGSDN